MTPLMSMSSFRAQPRVGHLERLKRMYGYVYRTRTYALKYRVEQPDVSAFDSRINLDWPRSVYGEKAEEIPDNAPKPLGNEVTLLHYFDAEQLEAEYRPVHE